METIPNQDKNTVLELIENDPYMECKRRIKK